MTPSEDQAQSDKVEELLTAAICVLMEHVDSVEIIVTAHTSGSTWMRSRGGGNWYARLGSIQEWLVKQDESNRDEVRVPHCDE